MRTLILLLKNNFINSFGINKLLQTNRKKLFLYAAFACYIIFSLFITSSSYAKMIADSLLKYHLLGFMITIFFVITSFSIFMFTIYNAKNNLFNAKDNDLLLSLPIRTETILASRFINVLLWNLITAIIFMGPALVIYANVANVNLFYYPTALLVFLLLPIIPTILASLVGYLIAYLTSKSNAKNWFEIILSFLFIFGLFYLMSNGQKFLTYLVNDMDMIEKIMKWFFYPIYLVNEIFSKNNYLSLFIFVVLNLILCYLFISILNLNFKKIIVKLQENKTKQNFVMKGLKVASINKTLLIKEFKRYFSSPIYVLNTSFGLVMMLVFAGASLFYDKDKILQILQMNMQDVSNFQLVLLLVVFVTLLSSTTASSISLEGKNFWIMKVLPISPKTILNSKILLNLLIVLPFTFLSIIVFKFTLSLSYIEMLMLFIIGTISSLLISQFGLLMNLKFPKMDAINDAAVVKRSVSAMMSILLPMVIVFTFVGVYPELIKIVSFNFILMIIIILMIIGIVIERLILDNWGTKRVVEIE